MWCVVCGCGVGVVCGVVWCGCGVGVVWCVGVGVVWVWCGCGAVSYTHLDVYKRQW